MNLQLSELLQHQHIICFGAGRALQTFCVIMRDTDLFCHIDYVVDNAESKWGKYVSLSNDIKVPVRSPEYMKTHIKDDTIILITCNQQESIRFQLSQYHELKDVEIFDFEPIKNKYIVQRARNVKLPASLRRTETPIIPKVIHYCWFGHNPLPERYKEWMQSWKKYCPDYEIVEWNESNYDVTKHPYMRAAYDAKKWGFVPDYARLDILYEHGGIYLDTDVELVKNLDPLLYQDGFAGVDRSGRLSLGLGFGAKKRLQIIKAMRDYYDQYLFVDFIGKTERALKNIQIAPDIQTRFMEKFGFIKEAFQYQIIQELSIYPIPVLCGQVLGKGNDELVLTEYTYSIHHYDGSWMSRNREYKKDDAHI